MKTLKLNDKVTLAKPAIDDRVYTIVNLFEDYEPGEIINSDSQKVVWADIRQNADDRPFLVILSELTKA